MVDNAPSTETVRGIYALANHRIRARRHPEKFYDAEFNRWLNAELAKAWDAGFSEAEFSVRAFPRWSSASGSDFDVYTDEQGFARPDGARDYILEDIQESKKSNPYRKEHSE